MKNLTYLQDFRHNFIVQGKTVGIICGGFSDEREVSLRSGRQVESALRKLGYQTQILDPLHDKLTPDCCDIAFIALHGKHGEDGSIQSLFKQFELPFTGPGPSASALAINKAYMKQFYVNHDIPTAPYTLFSNGKSDHPLSYPIILKPIDGGSSVDVAPAHSDAELKTYLSEKLPLYPGILGETFVKGTEVTVGVIDIKYGSRIEPTALPILELQAKNSFYDYEAKYTEGMTTFVCPANLDESTTAKCQFLAKKIHELLTCNGMSRTDMIIGESNTIHVLETNTIPGMTALSDLPAQAKAMGISFESLVEIILATASYETP